MPTNSTVSGGTFCATGTTTLTTTGATGGTFSAPAGLVINAATGVIDLATSTPNTYTISYSMEQHHVPEQQLTTVTISSQPTATVSGGTFCATGTTHLTTTGATGGTFSAGRTCINAATGVI
jgi:hypothetical protein